MTSLTIEEILDILCQELDWCYANGQKPELSLEQEWFVRGLKQAIFLILKFRIEYREK